jgi:hypothetical protein
MMEWMGQQMKSYQQPPTGRQAWVRKKGDVHPKRRNVRTYQKEVFMPRIWFLILRHQV